MYEPVKTFYMGSNPGEAPFITKVGHHLRQLLGTGMVSTAFGAVHFAPLLTRHVK